MKAISLTSRAINHFNTILQGKTNVVGVRIGVKSSGCSGLSYVLGFAEAVTPEDLVFAEAGISVVVDKKSLQYLTGIEIDYVQEGLNSFLKFNNPNQTSACGCGESFSTEK